MQEILEKMDRLTNETKREHLAVFDLEGNPLCDIIPGKRGEVDIPPEIMELAKITEPNSWIVVHTHPDAVSFSEADIRGAVSIKATHTEMVIGRGNIVYSFEVEPLRNKDLSINPFRDLQYGEMVSPGEFTLREWEALQPARDRTTIFQRARAIIRDNEDKGRYAKFRGKTFMEQGIMIRISPKGKSFDTYFTEVDRANQVLDVQKVMFSERFGSMLMVRRLIND